jgi:hypothetical protein
LQGPLQVVGIDKALFLHGLATDFSGCQTLDVGKVFQEDLVVTFLRERLSVSVETLVPVEEGKTGAI